MSLVSLSFLGLAILAEVVATMSLKASASFTRLVPLAASLGFYAVAFYFMSLAMRTVPVGIIYAIWSGVGIVFIGLFGWLLFGEKLDAPALAGIALILAGVLVINLFFASVSH